jgi:hypothetical protein
MGAIFGVMYSDRVFLIAAAVGALSLWFALRFLILWLRLLGRKYRRGVPYLWGSAGRAFVLFLPSVAVFAGAVLLGAAGWGLQGFQPLTEMVMVGTLEVRDLGPAGIAFQIRPDPGYPAGIRVPDTMATTGRWSVAGQFILWPRALQLLGLRNSHRVAWFLTVDDPSDIPAADKLARRSLLPSDSGRMYDLLRTWGARLRLVETREFQSPWESGSAAAVDLYAFPGGYLLMHPEPES